MDVIGQFTGPKWARRIQAQGGSVADVGQILARFAADRPHEDLTRLVHQLQQRLDQDGPEPDPTEERFLTLVTHADGSVTGRFHLDPLAAEKVQAALEAHRQADRPAGDQRTTDQRSGLLPRWTVMAIVCPSGDQFGPVPKILEAS